MRAISLTGVPYAPEPKKKRKAKKRPTPVQAWRVDVTSFGDAGRVYVTVPTPPPPHAPCDAFVPIVGLEWRCQNCGYTRLRHARERAQEESNV